MTLPPALYWSRSLAEHLNAAEESDPCNGLIDTSSAVFMAWSGGWTVLPGNELPADAVRLVAAPQAWTLVAAPQAWTS